MLSLCNLKAKYGKLSEYDQLKMAYVQGIKDALEVVKDHYSYKVDTMIMSNLCEMLEDMANLSTPLVVLNEQDKDYD